jgi:hypothetical protein
MLALGAFAALASPAFAADAGPQDVREGPAGSAFWDSISAKVAAGARRGDIYWVHERADAPSAGARNLLVWDHGTAGAEDSCAPSRRDTVSPQGRERTPALGALLARGYVVAESDYQGLGTPGATAYGNAEMEAKAALDVVRAARNFPRARVGDRFGMYGHSQGGRVTLWSDHLAAAYLPEDKLVGVFAMAPAVLRSDIIRAGFTNPHNAGYIIESLAGLAVGHPELRLRDIMTPKGLELLATMAGGCHDAWVAASVADEPIGRPEALVDGNPWWTWIKKQDEFLPLSAPAVIYQGDADRDVEVGWTRRVHAMICATGQRVEYHESPGVDHGGIVAIGAPHVGDWFDARFKGIPAESDCGRK